MATDLRAKLKLASVPSRKVIWRHIIYRHMGFRGQTMIWEGPLKGYLMTMFLMTSP